MPVVDPYDDPKTTAAMCDAIDDAGPVTTSEQQAVPVAQINWRDPIGVLPFGGGSLIPAVVVAGPDRDGDYRVSFRDKGNHGYLRGLQWFRDDGTACGTTGHRVIQARWDVASLTGFEFATKVRDPFPQPHIEATKLALTATPETFPHDSYSLAQWLDKALFTPVPSEDDATQTREAEGLDRLFSIEPNVGATTNEPSLHTILLGYYLPHFEYDEATRLADAYVAALNARGGA